MRFLEESKLIDITPVSVVISTGDNKLTLNSTKLTEVSITEKASYIEMSFMNVKDSYSASELTLYAKVFDSPEDIIITFHGSNKSKSFTLSTYQKKQLQSVLIGYRELLTYYSTK